MSLRKILTAAAVASALMPIAATAQTPAEPAKKSSIFFPPALVARAKANAAGYPWAKAMQDKAVSDAGTWMKMTDDEIWKLMFGPTIPRAWMVYSDGYCPACKQSVPMYNWKLDPFQYPWKVKCPHCGDLFPKNDFRAYYESGLDEHGVFDPKLADRSLLYNVDHPDPKDPLHMFGVDDGFGYVEGNKRWRFVGCSIVRGTWKLVIINGIGALATAYSLTGDPAYAHKAAIMIDRIADLYPSFDFMSQGWVYETQNANGYLTPWHDSCGETRDLAIAYDQIFDGIKDDSALVKFLSTKARRYKLDNRKASFADIQRNIEDRILRDSLANRKKVDSNYPQTDLNTAIIKTILDWPRSKPEVTGILGGIIDKGTAVDGVSGEKGLSCYSAWATRTIAELLARFSRVEPTFLQDAFKQHPNLNKTWQFWIDTWCLQDYYPNIGDSDSFRNTRGYSGIDTWSAPGQPSMYTFLYQLYKITGNPAYAQIEYQLNGRSVNGLPHDIFADDPAALQKDVKSIVDSKGLAVKMASANKEQWHLALLRSGDATNARVAWLDYDSGHEHGHANCMNLGLFAKGLDLMSDFGYAPVQYGGWDSPKANWYKRTVSHNTVVVDGEWQRTIDGKTTLWADGNQFRAIRASATQQGVQQFERTIAMVDTSASDFYMLDIFRVVGKGDHAKMQHTQAAAIAMSGLSLSSGEDYGHGAIFRNTRTDKSAKPGWSADYAIDDKRNPGVHVKITDLTAGAEASLCEAWVSPSTSSNDEIWIPETITRRQGASPLASTFVSVIEPYKKESGIASMRRLPLEAPSRTAYGDANAAVEVALADGRRDLVMAADVENPLKLKPSLAADKMLVQKDSLIRTDAELSLVRFDKAGHTQRIVICKGSFLRAGGIEVKLKGQTDRIELILDSGQPKVVSGDGRSVESIKVEGKNIWTP